MFMLRKKTKNLLGLVAAGATLASSSLLPFAAKPAQAASLTNNWSFSGLANTGGTFVVADNGGFGSSTVPQAADDDGGTHCNNGTQRGEGDDRYNDFDCVF
jgi:hypothetical protein